MIIEAKATRQSPAPADPAQRYKLEKEKTSRTPFALGLMLTGLVLYLKSLFPSAAETHEEEASPAPDEANGAAAPPMMAAREMPAELDPEPVGTIPQPGAGALGSGSGLIDLQPPAEFMLIESPDIGFAMPEPYIGWADLGNLDTASRAANDNTDVGATIPEVSGEPTDPLNPGDRVDPTDPQDPGSGDPDHPDGPGDPDGPDGPGDPDDPSDPPGDGDDDHEGPPECNGTSDCDEEETNRAPRVSGPVYLMDVTGCAILAIGLTDLLRNASDPDGDALSVKNFTVSSGTLTRSAEGWVFQGEPQLQGLVTVTYEVTDGLLSVAQTAYFSVLDNVVDGSCANDILIGTMCADEIDGMDGDDNIDARAGNDIVVGGSGDDHIVAGPGDDVVFAGIGNDIVFGGAGNDQISGGAGNDRLYAEAGDDIVFGDEGDDVVSGGDGKDVLDGGEGEDRVEGGAGDDLLTGGTGDDSLDGGAGDDVLAAGIGDDIAVGGPGDDRLLGEQGDDILVSGSGNDSLDGGNGDDQLDGGDCDDVLAGGAGDDLVKAGAGDDVIVDGGGEDKNLGGRGDDHVVAALDEADDHHDGGDGDDTLDYSQTTEGVAVDLVAGEACGTEIGNDDVASFEKVVGGSGNDHIIVDDAVAMMLAGGSGEDTFEFASSEEAACQPTTHTIMDFEVGDRIRMSKYDLFEKVLDELSDQFEEIYGDDIDEDDIPIRYRHDRIEELNRTFVEADFNDDDVWETTIALEGHRVLVVVEHA